MFFYYCFDQSAMPTMYEKRNSTLIYYACHTCLHALNSYLLQTRNNEQNYSYVKLYLNIYIAIKTIIPLSYRNYTEKIIFFNLRRNK